MKHLLRSWLPAPKWVIGLTFLGVITAAVVLLAAASGTLRYWTGEEELLPQLRGLFHLASDLTRPRPKLDPFTPVEYAGVNPYGVNTFLEQEVELAKRERAVAMVAEAGFHWIRQEFPWEDIEIHGKGDFEDRRQQPYRSAWEKYDNIVDLAEKYGLEIIARLSTPPDWSRACGDKCGTFAPPDNLDDFGDYVATVVQRYQGRIHYYQIWNEPNIYPEWGEQPVSPEAYTELLRIAYVRAKAVDPEVVIICGALAATIENDLYPHGMNDFLFLQRMYDAGAAPYFDVMSMQGYGLWSGPYDRRMRPRVLNFSRPLYIREIMVKNGDGHKPIWISEMNWNAIPPDHTAYPAYGRVTLEQQAEYVTLAYKRAQLEWPWVGVVNFWYFKRATDTERDQPMYYFRMVEPDFTPQPVYYAMQALIHSQPVLGLGLHQEDHWALAYAGQWQERNEPGAQLGKVMASADGRLTFHWRGTDLALRAAGPATLAMQVDGSATRRYELSDDFTEIVLARHLADAEHEITLTIAGGTARLDAIKVWQDAWWQKISLGAATAVAATVASVLVLRQRRLIES